MNTNIQLLHLAQLGAGLPLIEGWLLRHVVFPLGDLTLSWRRARALFLAEGERILRLANGVGDQAFLNRVLIPRPRGLEDCSHFYSIEMVMEHLIITGKAIEGIIRDLRCARIPAVKVDPAGLKPKGGRGVGRKVDFRQFIVEFDGALPEPKSGPPAGPTHYHPWLGLLTAKQWHTLAAMHQRMHRKQIESIARRL